MLNKLFIQAILSALILLPSQTFALLPKKYTISSDVLELSEKRKSSTLKGNVFFKNTENSDFLKSRFLTLLFSKKKDISSLNAAGNIRISYQDYSLNSNTLLLNSLKKTLKMEGGIQIKSKSIFVEADFLNYDYSKKIGVISSLENKQVLFKLVRINKGKKQNVSLKAKKLTFNEIFQQLILQSNVEAEDDYNDFKIQSERLEVLFDEKKEIKSLNAKGQVLLQQKNRTSSAREAIFNYGDETVTLIGNAYVKENGKMKISSDVIKMYLDSDKGVIQGNKQETIKVEIPL